MKKPKKKTGGSPPKSKTRTKKKAAKVATPPKTTGAQASNFIYQQVFMNGGLKTIPKEYHGPMMNAFALLEAELLRLEKFDKTENDTKEK